MKKRKYIYGCVLLVVIFCSSVQSRADQAKADIVGKEAFVLDLINRFRAAPFSHGISLGYDAGFLMEKKIVPETAFRPYVFDEELQAFSAGANAQLAGTDPKEPHGLLPVRVRMAETGAVFTFSSAMALETAGRIFVENLFKDELETGDFAFVLSTAYSHAGLSVVPGVVDARKNAWFFSLTLGSRFRTSDAQILHLINQVRAEPWTIQSYIPVYLLDLLQKNPRIYPIPGLSFHPVFPNTALHACAVADQDPDLPYPEMTNAELAGYYGYTGEFAAGATVSAANPAELAETDLVSELFSALLIEELRVWPSGSVVFSNQFTDAGAAVYYMDRQTMDPGLLSVCAGFGSPENDPQKARVYGVLFFDRNMDTLYSPGEEIAQETVSVYDRELNLAAQVVTDNAGYFSLALEPERQWVFQVQAEGKTTSQIIYLTDSQFVKMAVTPSFQ